ncbi:MULTISPECIES: kynureninase [unclassified Sphingomonas]|uniref:kynureninase n=1 Tax=unclassified Sphingomonas TaxID=196159 RepID=UPI0006FD4C01|nr:MULTISPECIES: kynureninase [unclassified Sphingomonas]KQM94974.1 kynureninase [Sphingomonas sp. Leaf226]MDY0968390.1 kynureninase [Sphingomonas sp. CFBP9021]RZM07723.1 MAG: kynureninase [Sphingomonas sp.]
MTLDEVRALDAADPLAAYREQFALPEGVIYLDGNSLGALPKATPAALADVATRQWGDRLIRSWNEGWIDAPQRIGAKIAPLIGAAADEVIIGDTTSTHLFKALVAALRANPDRHTVLSEAGNFPTDLHIAEGAVACVPGARLKVVARADLAEALDEDTAVLLLTHVHYKTGERFDMTAWTARAHDAGALMLWDLSHSVGAVPIDLNGADADLAVGCTYKYLNGGPGAPAFIYVATRWQDRLASPLSGWMGHAAPFAFEDAYRPAPGMKRWLAGTPAMLSTAALETALDLWADIDQHAVAAKSARLFDILAAAGDALGLDCVSPRDPAQRGSHISFRHPHAHAITQALIAHGVIGDFRDPDILRLGLTPLYLSHEDVWCAGEMLKKIVETGEWQNPQYSERLAVT